MQTKPSVSRADRAAARAKADRTHDRYVVRTYGLAPGEYAELLAAQNGRCAICMKVPRRRRLAVDHDHQTGRPRALLCYMCNKAIGQFEFDPMVAYNAASYLLSIHEDHAEDWRLHAAKTLLN